MCMYRYAIAHVRSLCTFRSSQLANHMLWLNTGRFAPHPGRLASLPIVNTFPFGRDNQSEGVLVSNLGTENVVWCPFIVTPLQFAVSME